MSNKQTAIFLNAMGTALLIIGAIAGDSVICTAGLNCFLTSLIIAAIGNK